MKNMCCCILLVVCYYFRNSYQTIGDIDFANSVNKCLADRGFLYIAMGFCEGGDLYGRLKDQKGRALEERQVVEWFVQIAMALQVSFFSV